MNKRHFLSILFLLFVIVILSIRCSDEKEVIRFGICADVHQDIMFDAEGRMKYFVDEMNREEVDFVVQLGDFCFPTEKNQTLLQTWNSFRGEKFHVLGNHDMDISTKREIMDYLGMETNYYSFDRKGIHFIVLDPNYYIDSSVYVPYANSNYYEHGSTRGNFSPDQLLWLKEDLRKTSNSVIVFSHQPLSSSDSTKNIHEVRVILESENNKAGYKKIIACFNGHTHTNNCEKINGIHYIQINSMSYKWLGSKYAFDERYSTEINAEYPSLKYTAPYKGPLYAIIEVHPGFSIQIKGQKSDWVYPSPWDLGYNARDEEEDSIPKISDRHLLVFED